MCTPTQSGHTPVTCLCCVMLRNPSVVYPSEYPTDTPEPPLWSAAKRGCHPDVLSLISSEKGLEERGGYMHCSPLAIAAAHNHGDVVFELVGSGADLLSKDRYHIETALHSAVRQYNARTRYPDESKEVASMLIWAMVGRGLTLDSVDECGRTALHLAVADNNESIVRRLLDNGANISCRDCAGTTPLKHSILDHNVTIAAVLIEYGADVNERYHHGRMPLHLCTDNQAKELSLLLLKHGADLEAIDYSGLNALAIVSQHGWLDGVQIITTESAKQSSVYVKPVSGDI
jgi:hypothetical protein